MAEENPETSQGWPEWLVGILMIEAMSIATGILMPITSNAEGGEWHLASVFGMAPSYLNDALMWYLVSNIVLFTIGSILWLRNRRAASQGTIDSPAGINQDLQAPGAQGREREE